MKIDKTALKRHIDHAKPNELFMLTVDALEKNAIHTNLRMIEKYLKSSGDCIVTVIKR